MWKRGNRNFQEFLFAQPRLHPIEEIVSRHEIQGLLPEVGPDAWTSRSRRSQQLPVVLYVPCRRHSSRHFSPNVNQGRALAEGVGQGLAPRNQGLGWILIQEKVGWKGLWLLEPRNFL